MSKSFRTIVEPLNHRGLIDYHHGVLMLGSCFSDNIGLRLQKAFFDVEINPFGTLYNPASIACGIDDILQCRKFEKQDLFQINGDNRWHSFSHHSSFSNIDSVVMLNKINEKIELANELLKRASTLIITFGTAWVYSHIELDRVVSNCHKLPSSTFIRRMMSIDEIVELWLEKIDQLRVLNPKLKIVFTVSPIRHLRDGAHENQLSKSVLHLAIERLRNTREDVIYFPAYEIMNDDLRDYRFYAADMSHPTDVAVDYIYEIFSKSFLDEETIKISQECEKLSRRLSHRVMSDDSEAVARFELATAELKKTMLCKYPFLDRTIK